MPDLTIQQFGNYQLIRLIGKGSFGDVYLGEHVLLKTYAAIKVLRIQLSDDDQKNFLREAQIISRLKHKNIVPMLEYGVENGTPFLVMDYNSHGTLRQQHGKGTRLNPIKIVPYVWQIADALRYIHDEHVIHCDIKPENLLVGADDEVLLSDFGLALGTQSSRSQSLEEIACTVSYMSPELLKGNPCPASDQYALGIVVYEWLSGDVPFHGSFSEIASQQLLASPPSLSKVPSVSADVEEVVLTALAKDPQQRFANIQAFAQAFEQASLLEEETFKPTPHTFIPLLPTEEYNMPTEKAAQLTQSQSKYSASSTTIQNTTAQSHPRRKLAGFVAPLLTVLALFIVISSLGFFYINSAQQHNAPATYVNVPATATALVLEDMYTKATSRKPVFDNSLQGKDFLELFPLNKNTYPNIQTYTVNHTNIEDGKCSFTGEAYHAIADHVPVGYYQGSPLYRPIICAVPFACSNNFAYQVQMTLLHGDEEGVLFGLNQDPKTQVLHYNQFTINQTGLYTLLSLHRPPPTKQVPNPTPITEILAHSSAQAFRPGLDRANILTVIAQGERIYLYLNGQYVADVSDSMSTSGVIGVVAIDDTMPTDIAFNNVKVWQL